MEKIYIQYAEVLSEVASLDFKLSNRKRALEEIGNELGGSDNEGYGLTLSAHAFTNIANRLNVLSSENTVIYNDVMNTNNPEKCLLWPSNMKAFVVSMIAGARIKNEFSIEKSKNNIGSKEYRYEIEIKKWANHRKDLYFIAIVEGTTIKTGFFNWIDKNRSNNVNKST